MVEVPLKQRYGYVLLM